MNDHGDCSSKESNKWIDFVRRESSTRLISYCEVICDLSVREKYCVHPLCVIKI